MCFRSRKKHDVPVVRALLQRRWHTGLDEILVSEVLDSDHPRFFSLLFHF